MEESDWARLITQLRQGHCTPFLGAGACAGVLPTGAEMCRKWADHYKYPFVDNMDLARVMQYGAFHENDDIYLKEKVRDFLAGSGSPRFSDPSEPHALLASFPIPVFLTTNYDDFLIRGLEQEGKQPNSALCPWSPGVRYDSDFFGSDAGLNPDSHNPLVYYLHGSMTDPKSMVLTENDYLEFLVRIAGSADNQSGVAPVIPSPVLSALTDKPLLFIGYSLQDWTFRIIFRGLLDSIPHVFQRRSISVQMLPPVDLTIEQAETRARDFMSRYLEPWNISIFWGTAAEFCAEVRRRTGGAA